MRIAIVTPEYPPDVIGGGGIVVESLVREFAKRHEVRVFTAWDSRHSWTAGPLREFEGGAMVSRYPVLPLSRKPYLRSVLPPNPRALLSLWKGLSGWRPTVAHLHGFGYATVDVAAFMLRRKRIPYVLTVHGIPVTPERKGTLIRLAYSGYLRFGAGRTTVGAHAITAISDSVAKSIPRAGRVVVIRNGYTPLPKSDAGRAEGMRSALNIVPGVPVIVSAGRLTRSKGFDVLIKALTYVDLPMVACVLAGADGGLLPELAELEARRPPSVAIRIVGRLDRQGIADLFELASVVAVPSRDEPFGLVALEALAIGRRVVASKVGGLSEFLSPPVAELVPAGDPIALGAALTRAIGHGALSPQESAAADQVVGRHSWQALATQYEDLLESQGQVTTVIPQKSGRSR